MDQDLVVRAQKGDRRAFETLALDSHPRLHKVAYGILRDAALAEDVTQQGLLDIWRNLGGLHDPRKYDGWSYRILVNACHAGTRRTPTWLPRSEVTPAREPTAPDAFGRVARSTWPSTSARLFGSPSRTSAWTPSCWLVCASCGHPANGSWPRLTVSVCAASRRSTTGRSSVSWH